MSISLIRGHKIHYTRLGSGPPLVLIHGLLVGNLASWYLSIAPHLAKKYDVLMYDLRGHGLSQVTPSGYKIVELAEDLQSLLVHLGWDSSKLLMAGHSYGGLIALNYVLTYSQEIQGLSLIDVPLPPSQFSDLEAIREKGIEGVLEDLPVSVRTQIRKGGRRARRQLKKWSHLVQNTSLLSDLYAEPDIENTQLAQINCPVLTLYGINSQCKPVSQRLSQVLPNHTSELIQGGHFLLNEAPQIIAQKLLYFFQNI